MTTLLMNKISYQPLRPLVLKFGVLQKDTQEYEPQLRTSASKIWCYFLLEKKSHFSYLGLSAKSKCTDLALDQVVADSGFPRGATPTYHLATYLVKTA